MPLVLISQCLVCLLLRGRLIKAVLQSPEARFIAVHVDAQLRYGADGGARGQDAADGGGGAGTVRRGSEEDDADARRKAVMASGGREGRKRGKWNGGWKGKRGNRGGWTKRERWRERKGERQRGVRR